MEHYVPLAASLGTVCRYSAVPKLHGFAFPFFATRFLADFFFGFVVVCVGRAGKGRTLAAMLLNVLPLHDHSLALKVHFK